jgi:hypothetical protein
MPVAKADPVWNTQSIDANAQNVGLSIALDSSGSPHILYCSTPSGDSFYHPTPQYLMYASWNGSDWNTQIVDENSYIDCSALAFDSNNSPHIAYVNGSFLKYATLNGTRWVNLTVGIGFGGSIAVDSMGNPHIAYADNDGMLKYASWTGANWTIQTVDPDFLRPQFPSGAINAFQYLALDVNDTPSIVYSDLSTVKIAMGRASGWSIQTVISNESMHLGNVVVDSYGFPSFTYVSVPDGSLLYARWNGSAWTIQVVDYVTTGWPYFSFVKLDSNDNPKITYMSNGPNQDYAVHYAGWNGSAWEFLAVGNFSSWEPCYFAPFALDSYGNPHVCYLVSRITWNRSTIVWADGTLFYATSNQPTLTPSPTPSPSVPEFPTWIVLPLVLVATVVGVLAYFRKRRRN